MIVERFIDEDIAPLLERFLKNMDRFDYDELYDLSVGHPKFVISGAIYRSVHSYVYTFDDEPVMMGGVQTDGLVWGLSATRLLEQHKREFLRYSLYERDVFKTKTARPLRALVDERWTKSVRWLKWLGFEEAGRLQVMGRNIIDLRLEHARRTKPALLGANVPSMGVEATAV